MLHRQGLNAEGSTSGGGSRNGGGKVHGEAGEHIGAATNGEAKMK